LAIYLSKKKIQKIGLVFNLLVDFNKSWAKDAAVLIVVVSKMEFEYNGKSFHQ
jgi:hypothetical protein